MKGLLERFACGKPTKQPDNDLHDHDYESVVLYEPMGSMTFLCASKHQSRLQALAAKNPPGIHWQGTEKTPFWRSIVYLKTGINITYPFEKNRLHIFVYFFGGSFYCGARELPLGQASSSPWSTSPAWTLTARRPWRKWRGRSTPEVPPSIVSGSTGRNRSNSVERGGELMGKGFPRLYIKIEGS